MTAFDVNQVIDLDNGETLGYYADGHIDIASFVQEVHDEEDTDISPEQVKHGYIKQYPLDPEEDCTDYCSCRLDFSLRKHGNNWKEVTYWGDL